MPVVGLKLAGGCIVENVGFRSNVDTAIQATSGYNRIRGCYDTSSTVFYENVTNPASNENIVGNISSGVIQLDTMTLAVVVGNRVKDIYATGSDGNIIADNQIYLSATHGIHLNSCSDNTVRGNRVSLVSVDVTNTGDGIFLDGNSDWNLIEGNRIFEDGVGNVARYGINVSEAVCDCNIVVGNVLGLAANYGTSGLNDSGTLTQLFYPSDPNYGDNFVDCGGS